MIKFVAEAPVRVVGVREWSPREGTTITFLRVLALDAPEGARSLEFTCSTKMDGKVPAEGEVINLAIVAKDREKAVQGADGLRVQHSTSYVVSDVAAAA